MVVNVATRILQVGVLAFTSESIILPRKRNWKMRAMCSQKGFLMALWSQKQQERRR